MSVFSLMRCPVCHGDLSLSADGRSLMCESRHTFDFAASGYVNLLAPGKKNNAVAGDPKEMVRARSLFLSGGTYNGISDGLNRLIGNGGVCVDCGCGEGCQLCKTICTDFAPEISDADTMHIRKEECVACGMCFNRCPNGNIEMVNLNYTV